jgi:hypothetical protein
VTSSCHVTFRRLGDLYLAWSAWGEMCLCVAYMAWVEQQTAVFLKNHISERFVWLSDCDFCDAIVTDGIVKDTDRSCFNWSTFLATLSHSLLIPITSTQHWTVNYWSVYCDNMKDHLNMHTIIYYVPFTEFEISNVSTDRLKDDCQFKKLSLYIVSFLLNIILLSQLK